MEGKLFDVLISDGPKNDDEKDGKPQDGHIHTQLLFLSIHTYMVTNRCTDCGPRNYTGRNKLLGPSL